MLIAEPPASRWEGQQNRISGINFMCAINRAPSNGSWAPVAGTGVRLVNQSGGEFDTLSFAACKDYDMHLTTNLLGSDTFRNRIHDIYMDNALAYDGIGIFVTGKLGGANSADAGANSFDTLVGAYKNRAMMQIVTLDANHIRLPYFFPLPERLDNVFGLDISGSVYGSNEPSNHTYPLAVFWAPTDVIMRGLESTALPPQMVNFHIVEPTQAASPKVTLRPGHGSVSYTTWMGDTRFNGPLRLGDGINDTVELEKESLYIGGSAESRILMGDTRLAGNQLGGIGYDGGSTTLGGGWRFLKMGDDGSVLSTLFSITQDTGKLQVFPTAQDVGLSLIRPGIGTMNIVADTNNDFLNGITEEGDNGIFSQGPLVGAAPGLVIAPWQAATSGLRMDADGRIGLGTSTPTSILSLTGQADQIIGMERQTTADTPGNQLTLRAGGATVSASNQPGGFLILSAGQSTGNQVSRVNIQAPIPGTSATTTNVLVNRAIFNGVKNLTSGVASTIATVTTAAGQMGGGVVTYTVSATDGTDLEVASGQVAFSLVNKAGTRTGVTSILGTEALAKSDAGDNMVNTFAFSGESLQVTSTLTGMTATTYRIVYAIMSNSLQNVVAQ